ncbi:MAG TPA: hypothetical protein VMA37_16665 [Acetobacteraceae bacterium]|nr:hypothetical protein [Acetobacteraceae bacterium]
MLEIETFDQRRGGNVVYKALAHPLAAEAVARLYARLAGQAPVALFDPDGIAPALLALHPDTPPLAGIFVQDVREIGAVRAGLPCRPLSELAGSGARAVLIAAFDTARMESRIAAAAPPGAPVIGLDAVRLPEPMLGNTRRYLDPLNFATNYAFFRDQDGLSTRLVTANYWAGYGARDVRFWLRLFGAGGETLASWEEKIPEGPGGIAIDSRAVRARFDLHEFTGQLFLHAIGASGHDVVKYALDTFSTNGARHPALSCTHDANAWPAARYAGLPAPRADENVLLWVQNSHAAPIPPGGITFDRMGAEAPVPLPGAVPPYATVAVDIARLLPGVRWPAQIEVRAGRHVVRPRYEVVRSGRPHIAHVNVERADLRPDPGLRSLSNLLGRGHLLPFPVLPQRHFRSIVQPTPMAETQATLPLRLELFDNAGTRIAEHFLGCLPRNHDIALDLDTVLSDDSLAEAGGHAELVYDFRDGGEADGWMHALMRYEHRSSGHAAETSFGSHMFNTLMTYKDEPQSYAGPPPGLSTRLFLKLGEGGRRSFTVLIYPASAPWRPHSETALLLHDSAGRVIAEERIIIACSGSAMIFPDEIFPASSIAAAGPAGYVLVRDTTCRLFGYHGLMMGEGAFSLDHMFGF